MSGKLKIVYAEPQRAGILVDGDSRFVCVHLTTDDTWTLCGLPIAPTSPFGVFGEKHHKPCKKCRTEAMCKP